MKQLTTLRQAFVCALPVMLGYLVIGIPCGIMSAAAGLSPVMCLLLSCSFYSGAGQFMVAPMLLAGTSLPAIIASVVLVSTRQVLYSAAFSPYFKRVGKLQTMLFSLFVTDESFGVLMDKMASSKGFDQNGELLPASGQKDSTTASAWTVNESILTNLFCMASWTVANVIGALAGAVVNLPVALLSFGMTSIFICLLVGQPKNAGTLVCVVGAFAGVFVCKLANLGSLAILLGAICGVVAGMVFESVRHV